MKRSKKQQSIKEFRNKPIQKESIIEWDENISSDDENVDEPINETIDDIDETIESKRIRMAKEYLSMIKSKVQDDNDNDDNELYGQISSKLSMDRLTGDGKYFRNIADNYETIDIASTVSFSGPKKPLTSLAISADTIYAGSKDNSIYSWDIESGKKNLIRRSWQHTDEYSTTHGEVLCLCMSYDGKFLVSGGRDGFVRVHDPRLKEDRSIKSWGLSEMSYIETLFGHQAGITSMDCCIKDTPVTASVDRTVRLWNIKEGSHLVYKGCKSFVDCVKLITDDTFISGGLDGSISLWKKTMRKPLVTVLGCHGLENERVGNNFSICSLATVSHSDIAISES
eukprot:gene17790-23398_t